MTVTSVSWSSTESIRPRKYPAIEPKVTATSTAMRAASVPTQMGSAPEFTRIVKVSLPSYWVPSQCSADGEVQIFAVSTGLCWSTRSGPMKENATMDRTSTVPANPAGERVSPVHTWPPNVPLLDLLERPCLRGLAMTSVAAIRRPALRT